MIEGRQKCYFCQIEYDIRTSVALDDNAVFRREGRNYLRIISVRMECN